MCKTNFGHLETLKICFILLIRIQWEAAVFLRWSSEHKLFDYVDEVLLCMWTENYHLKQIIYNFVRIQAQMRQSVMVKCSEWLNASFYRTILESFEYIYRDENGDCFSET
jgi:hypothetical protein